MKKLSVLGIVLMAAAGITAAVLPTKSSQANQAVVLGACEVDQDGATCTGVGADCNVTAGSVTTAVTTTCM